MLLELRRKEKKKRKGIKIINMKSPKVSMRTRSWSHMDPKRNEMQQANSKGNFQIEKTSKGGEEELKLIE
jgi:hypothetical protein